MRYKVTGKQESSKMCFICGKKNAFGLKASFYETDKDDLIAIFRPKQEHQGYPGRLHGGIAAAILDETIGRNINMGRGEDVWGVTLEFSIKYKKPIPLEEDIRVVTRLTAENKRIFEGEGEVVLEDGTIAATGKGKYLKLPIGKIADFDLEENEWKVIQLPDDPDYIEI
jgi:acyl-coenzyme A thioesterase PaaI-like protein